jgi:uncharacterized protein
MQDTLTRREALSILTRVSCPDNVIKHCIAVSDYAVHIARKIRERGHTVDVSFVETAALLHDIGRSKTHGIAHGIEGAKMLADHPRYARVCERHIGAGLTKEEARKLGLPERDYLPETLEEKIIAHADNLVDGERVCSVEEALESFKTRLGGSYPAVARIRALAEFISSLSD